MKRKHVQAYMDVAETFAQCSSAKRLKVGAIIVKDDRIISIGYNGTPSGWDNVCEDGMNKTKPEVLHAESNAITKLAKSTESGDGAIMFCTHAPCLNCAKLIAQSGISEIYFREYYRDRDGVEFLGRCNVQIHHANEGPLRLKRSKDNN